MHQWFARLGTRRTLEDAGHRIGAGGDELRAVRRKTDHVNPALVLQWLRPETPGLRVEDAKMHARLVMPRDQRALIWTEHSMRKLGAIVLERNQPPASRRIPGRDAVPLKNQKRLAIA